MKSVKFTSFLDEIEKEMGRAEKEQRKEAARYLRKQLKSVAKEKFGSQSDITAGVRYANYRDFSEVGMGKPAYHAHLIEFGTDNRFTKAGKSTGYIKADPFVFPTFNREKNAVIDIMSKMWF